MLSPSQQTMSKVGVSTGTQSKTSDVSVSLSFSTTSQYSDCMSAKLSGTPCCTTSSASQTVRAKLREKMIEAIHTSNTDMYRQCYEWFLLQNIDPRALIGDMLMLVATVDDPDIGILGAICDHISDITRLAVYILRNTRYTDTVHRKHHCMDGLIALAEQKQNSCVKILRNVQSAMYTCWSSQPRIIYC
jgi:hypothetical protein